MGAEMFSGLRPLWWSSLAFGAAPLGLLPFRAINLVWSLAYLMFFSIYCSFEATSIRLKEIPKFVQEGDFTSATITFVGLIFTLLSSSACCTVLMHIFNSSQKISDLQAKLDDVCNLLGVSLAQRLSRRVRRFLTIFWPFVVYWSVKEVGIYYDIKEFYVTIFECLSVFNRLTLIHIEEQFRTYVEMQKWVFQDINSQLEALLLMPMKSSQEVQRLEILRKCHHNVCDMGAEICELFQSSLVLTIAMNNLDMVQGVYYSFINAADSLGARSMERQRGPDPLFKLLSKYVKTRT
ncbi:Hypothetical predicted protein [Cloeon dipterum]|uniref:Gustatory receptor n=1 Tax=Cloeon dipterum TaxID=197152 RepID=A0A8S1C3B1_9INSE|nr:Hypothetical predicted protein [Cloeon dipterum]